jgi:DNA polymerase III delta prime subunit
MAKNEKQTKMSWAELYGAPTVTVSEAKSVMRLSWGDARPVVLVGAPGIGKTQAMLQVAEEYRKDNNIAEEDFGSVYVMMSHVDREVLTGLPYFEGVDVTTFKHMHHEQFAKELSKPHGIIIFDEFNRPRDVSILNAFFAWVTERGANGLKLNDGWNIVGAINPSSGDYMVSQVEKDGAVRRRLCWLEVMHNNLETLQYMTANIENKKFHPEVVKFLRENPQHCFDESALDAGKIGPTPASWQDVSRKIYKNEDLHAESRGMSNSLLQLSIAGHIGVGVASVFMASYERHHTEDLPSVFDVLRHYTDDPGIRKAIKDKVNNSTIGATKSVYKEGTEDDGEDTEEEVSVEQKGDSKGYLLQLIEGLTNTVASTPFDEFMKELKVSREDTKELTTDSKKIKFLCKKLAPSMATFLMDMTEDLFSMYMANMAEVGKSSKEAKDRLIELGAAMSRVPGFTETQSRNRKVVNSRG